MEHGGSPTNILSSDFNLTPTTLHGVSHLTSLLNEPRSTPHGMVAIGVFPIKVVSNAVDSDVFGGTKVARLVYENKKYRVGM